MVVLIFWTTRSLFDCAQAHRVQTVRIWGARTGQIGPFAKRESQWRAQRKTPNLPMNPEYWRYFVRVADRT